MRIEAFACQRYSVPFRVPFRTSRGLERSRQGMIVQITTDDGRTGYGESVALSGFGTGDLDEIDACLRSIGDRMPGQTPADVQDLLAADSHDTRTSPARFALDTAILDIQSQEAGRPLAQLLRSDSARSVPLNATISDMDADRAASAAYYAVIAGYTAIKMKVGAFSDPAAETRRVAAVREAIGPDTELRLDANGAWTLEQAVSIDGALSPYNIAYFEQPLPASHVGAMAQLRARISTPIAADEAAGSRSAIEELIALEAADVIIVKPAVTGGISAAREIIEQVTAAGMHVVVTTALETGVAITAALHLAATLPVPVPACGLATGALLETDLLVESPEISGGRMTVPASPGLGVEPLPSIWN